MKERVIILLLSLTIAVVFWFSDSLIDYYLYYDKGFFDVLTDSLETYYRFFIGTLIVSSVMLISFEILRRKEIEARDIKKQIEEELKMARATVEAIADGISIQGKDFRVLYQNSAHKALTGDQKGRLCYEAYAKSTAICPGCPVERSFKDGGTYKLEKTDPKRNLYIEIVSSPLRNQKGEITACIEAVRDITDRKLMEMALSESEKRYRTLFENAADAIFLIEAEGENIGAISSANRAAALMHGYSLAELLGMKITDLDAPEAAAQAPQRIKRIASGETLKFEIVHRRKDGSLFPVEVSATPLELSGKKYILAFDRDITERKMAEKEKEALIAKLTDATNNIKTLTGLLPICAWCKKIRDDEGYWTKVEEYIEKHSDVMFTHGICPECLEKHSPDPSD